MKQVDAKTIIAKRVAREFSNGDVVNLGIGLPTLAVNYLPQEVCVVFHSENGFVGLAPAGDDINPNLVNAGAQPCGLIPGAAMFDSAMSFALIRGGHIDMTVLGGLQVDETGNLANWTIPGKLIPGMGGAMDLVVGAKRVIVAMEHCSKDGSPKILKKCTLPLTGKGVVSMIITELGVFSVGQEGLTLEEIMPGVTLKEIQLATEAEFLFSPALKNMEEYAV